MILDPATYPCPVHTTDLTDQVVAQLEDDDGWPVAYKRRRTRDQPEFEVVVTCPGAGTAHAVTCRGIRRP
jgi:hypothetical protein